ncbi:MAG: urease accessory protein UreD [Pseudomonadota bacterium]
MNIQRVPDTPKMATPSPVRFQRTSGYGLVSSKLGAHGRSRIDRLFQEGAARIRAPEPFDHQHLEAVLINTAGGLTGGDHIAWSATAGQNSTLSVTTQACEKVYKSTSGAALVDVDLKVEAGSTLFWLPQETILFDQAQLHRTIRANLAQDATLLVIEGVIFGRKAMRESVKTGSWRDHWRIHHQGTLIHAENVRLDGQIAEHLDNPAGLNGMTALATLALFGNDVEKAAAHANAALKAHPAVSGGASAWHVDPGSKQGEKLIVRVAAQDGYDLRQALISLINAITHALSLKNPLGLPAVWST